MTVVTGSFNAPGQSGNIGFSGSLWWVPTARHTGGTGIVLPVPFIVQVDSNGTMTPINVDPTGPTWVWKVTEQFAGIAQNVLRYVQVPASGPVAYKDLVDVDPTSLAPIPASPTATDAWLATGVQGPLTAAQLNATYAPVTNLFQQSTFPIWQKALAKAIAGEADARILCVGDSTTGGIGSGASGKTGTPTSFPYQMVGLLSGQVASSPGMGVPASSLTTASDDRWTPGAGWALSAYGWASGSCWFAQTGIVTPLVYNPAGYGADATTYDSFDIYYITNSSGPGTFNAQATGGTSVPVNAAVGSGDTAKVTITCPASSTATVTITPVSGQVYIVGIEPFNSAVKRVRVANAGVPSSKTSDWIAQSTTFGAIPAIKRYAADLTIISLGINDAIASVDTTTYNTNLGLIINAAAVSGDVLLLCPVPSQAAAGATTVKFERAYSAAMLASSKTYANLKAALGTPGAVLDATQYFDNLHPNSNGYAKIAARVYAGVFMV